MMTPGLRKIAISFALSMLAVGSYWVFFGKGDGEKFTIDIRGTKMTARCVAVEGVPPTQEQAREAVNAFAGKIATRSEQVVAAKHALTQKAAAGETASIRDKAVADLSALEDDPKAILKSILDDIRQEYGCWLT